MSIEELLRLYVIAELSEQFVHMGELGAAIGNRWESHFIGSKLHHQIMAEEMTKRKRRLSGD